MQNFEFVVPVNIIFGKGSIAKLGGLVPADARVLLVYGKGSAKSNGAYDQVIASIKPVAEFSGIEPNPEFDTLMKAVAVCKENNVDFIVALGGGSVVDGVKFIAAALNWTKTADPWDLLIHANDKDYAAVAKIKFGVVMTLPATGSEANCGAVISRHSLGLKLGFMNRSVFPQFSILDPDFINSLPPRQVSNGVVDAFVHVLEQYTCHYNMSAVGDEFSEGLLRVLSTAGKEVALATAAGQQAPYGTRADYWWATTQALNGLISAGVRQCWAIHAIGHEITTYYGLDHAQTLALVVGPLLRFEKENRRQKLSRMAERVFGVRNASDMAEEAIVQTEKLFKEVGQKSHFSEYGLDGKHFETIAAKFEGHKLAAERNISREQVLEILKAAL